MGGSRPTPRGRGVAVVDCGSNATRLLVADVAGGTLRRAQRYTAITRLGRDVDHTGALSEDAVERVLHVLQRYVRQWREAGVEQVAVCATSAVRDAANADAFVRRVEDTTGVTPVVLSGVDEAELTFAGATAGWDGDWRDRRTVVCDVGGGSTELIVGTGLPEHRVSVQLGSVRLRERHLHHDPPTRAEYAAVIADIDAGLVVLPDVYAATGGAPLVAVAGTATTLGAVAAGVAEDAVDRIDGMVLPAAALAQLIEDLAWAPARYRLSHPGIVPGREDVVVTGALLLSRVLQRFGHAALQVRVADLLDGVALRVAACGWPPADCTVPV